jgi:hypothetical protein
MRSPDRRSPAVTQTFDDTGNADDDDAAAAGKFTGRPRGDSDPEPLGAPRRTGQQAFNELQRLARAEGRATGKPVATQEYLTRHTLESFLVRLTTTGHAKDFILKGGLLTGAYDVRRPTKDVDSNAISATVSEEWLTQVARDVAECDASDGVTFDQDSLTVETIREQQGYRGVRVRMPSMIGPARGELAWDVSTGDPIVPPPRLIQLQRVLGDPIPIWSYPPETIIAEKAVTILERGITSTRWRDYVDIVQLHRQQTIDQASLLQAVQAVARHRQVKLRPIDDVVAGYGDLSQAKWAAWRRKNKMQDICDEQLDDQMKLIAHILNPIFEND